MKDEYKILYVLVLTFCFSILMGMVGVFVKLVDAQFVEGLISGGLISLITMLFKDILGRDEKVQEKPTVAQINPTVEVKP